MEYNSDVIDKLDLDDIEVEPTKQEKPRKSTRKKGETRGRKPYTEEQRRRVNEKKRLEAQKRRIHNVVAKDIAKKLIEADETLPSRLRIEYGLPNDISNDIRKYIMGSSIKWFVEGYNPPENSHELAIRTEKFFMGCFEVEDLLTWEKYCLTIGYDVETVGAWLRGVTTCAIPPSEASIGIIKKAKVIFANYDTELMMLGKYPAIPYIFRAKNYYGMKDTQERVVTREEYGSGIKDVEELRLKYLEASAYDPEDIE